MTEWKFHQKNYLYSISDLASRDGEIQKLNNEVSHVKEIFQRQTHEKEQLSQQLIQNVVVVDNKI